ncbi:AAA family ATPase [Arthrobacter psychrolactophilus]
MRRACSKDIIEHLKSPQSKGVLIVGESGTGKTWMLGQVLATLGSDSASVRLSPNKALASIPFGAVNARIDVDLSRSTDYYQVLQGLLDQIETCFESASNVYLVVDNGEHVDEQSAAVIMQVILTTGAKLVFVEGSRNRQSILRELWRDGHITRFEMGALDTGDTLRFLDNLLGGPVAASTAQFLTHHSAGNALIIKGLVASALAEGSLRKVDGVWMLIRPDAIAGPESQDQLQIDLEHLQPTSNRIVEILALAGSLPLELLFTLTDAEVLDDIQQNNLVSIIPGKPLTMALARPGTALQIREATPVGRSRVLFDELSTALDPDTHMEPHLLVNLTRWAVDCGAPVEDGRILAAATAANQLVRLPEGRQLSHHPVDKRYGAELLAQRAISHYYLREVTQARTCSLQSMAPGSYCGGRCCCVARHSSRIYLQPKLQRTIRQGA